MYTNTHKHTRARAAALTPHTSSTGPRQSGPLHSTPLSSVLSSLLCPPLASAPSRVCAAVLTPPVWRGAQRDGSQQVPDGIQQALLTNDEIGKSSSAKQLRWVPAERRCRPPRDTRAVRLGWKLFWIGLMHCHILCHST